MKYFWDDFAPVVVAIFLIIVISGVLVGAASVVESHQCSNYQEITGKETDYRFLDSCYVHTADGWQRWGEYMTRGVASEGLKEASK